MILFNEFLFTTLLFVELAIHTKKVQPLEQSKYPTTCFKDVNCTTTESKYLRGFNGYTLYDVIILEKQYNNVNANQKFNITCLYCMHCK